jgi:hypothetical protein
MQILVRTRSGNRKKKNEQGAGVTRGSSKKSKESERTFAARFDCIN